MLVKVTGAFKLVHVLSNLAAKLRHPDKSGVKVSSSVADAEA